MLRQQHQQGKLAIAAGGNNGIVSHVIFTGGKAALFSDREQP